MPQDSISWRERDAAERKVLIYAREEGYVRELLPPSFVVTKDGMRQDHPELELSAARLTLVRLINMGLVGTYFLDSDDLLTGKAAMDSIASAEAWDTPESGGLCLFLTPLGQQALGIG